MRKSAKLALRTRRLEEWIFINNDQSLDLDVDMTINITYGTMSKNNADGLKFSRFPVKFLCCLKREISGSFIRKMAWLLITSIQFSCYWNIALTKCENEPKSRKNPGYWSENAFSK